jgi:hypothetical protein
VSWIRRSVVVVAGIAAAACALLGVSYLSPSLADWVAERVYLRTPDAVVADPSALEGPWLVQLPRGPCPGLRPDAGDPLVVRLTLVRERERDSLGVRVLTPATFVGTFRVEDHGWLARDAVGDSAGAFVSRTGEFLMYLEVGGGCGDCGDIDLHGWLRRDGARLTGMWGQEFLSGGRADRRASAGSHRPALAHLPPNDTWKPSSASVVALGVSPIDSLRPSRRRDPRS